LDVGDRTTRVYELDGSGQCRDQRTIGTTMGAMTRQFAGRPRARVILEVGTHSPWISRLLTELGHEVVVANPSAMYGRRRRRKRNDAMDAEYLARQGRADVALLHPVRHRGPAAQVDLELLRARDQLVGVRTKLINHVRGSVKALGCRIEPCSAPAFGRRARAAIPAALQAALSPLLALLDDVSAQIRTYDRAVVAVARERYPETARVQQPTGVGPLTALAFVLLVDDPRRFRRSRDMGAYFGLVPRLDESGSAQPQLRITKAGDELGRRLLVSAAQYILGPFGPDCDLRRHGLALAQRGGRNAKKRAVVAVARKLAVLLHTLWITNQTYDPDWLARRRAA
jgi:transposase